MTQLTYDGSFAGWLTAVFEVFEKKYTDVTIVRAAAVEALSFSENRAVVTDETRARRVWLGLRHKFSAEALKNIYWCFLSELKGIENTMLAFVKYAYASAANIESDFGHAAVLAVAQIARKVGREKHRFEAFVRFESLEDDLFYAPVEPDYNVLPIIAPHFKRRYAGQSWIIYDLKRKYGIHYDQQSELLRETVIDFVPAAHQGQSIPLGENHYQDLWRAYFKSVNIPARKNMKLHLQHVPKRYWKYLVEKTL